MDEDERTSLANDQTRVPFTNIHRVMRKGIPAFGKASKEAKETVQDIIQEFIGFVTSEAKGICHRDKRKVLGGDDILNALENLDMKKYSEILKMYQKNYRKSLIEVPAESDVESDSLPTIKGTVDDYSSPNCANSIRLESLDGMPSASLPESYKFLGLPVWTKTPSKSSTDEDHCPSLKILSEEDINLNVTEDSCGLVDSKVVFGKNEDNVNAEASDDHNITVPAWKIPPALISGIRISAINIPELTVSVKLLGAQDLTMTTRKTLPAMSDNMDRVLATNIEKNLGTTKSSPSAQVMEPEPSTEVIDLISPTSCAPLQVLTSDALDSLDFNASLVDNMESKYLSNTLPEELSSPKEAAAKAVILSAQCNVNHC